MERKGAEQPIALNCLAQFRARVLRCVTVDLSGAKRWRAAEGTYGVKRRLVTDGEVFAGSRDLAALMQCAKIREAARGSCEGKRSKESGCTELARTIPRTSIALRDRGFIRREEMACSGGHIWCQEKIGYRWRSVCRFQRFGGIDAMQCAKIREAECGSCEGKRSKESECIELACIIPRTSIALRDREIVRREEMACSGAARVASREDWLQMEKCLQVSEIWLC